MRARATVGGLSSVVVLGFLLDRKKRPCALRTNVVLRAT
jgi:hypothetical protein